MTPAPVTLVQRLLDRWNASRPGRVVKRFGDASGGVLAAGIAYYGVFSIFPALAIGFTVLAAVLGAREDLQADLVEFLNRTFGFELVGLTPDDGAVVSVDALVQSTTIGTSAVLGTLVLLYTGLGWLSATRAGIRTVAGQPPGQNFFVGKLWDLLTLTVLGALILVSVASSVAVTTFTGAALDWLGIESALVSVVVTVLTGAGVVAVDFAVLWVFFRVLSGVRLPRGDIAAGAAVGAVGLGLLTLAGGLVLRAASRNQFLATFGAVVVLLLWANLAARVCLLAASWTVTVGLDRGHLRPAHPELSAATVASRDAASGTAEDDDGGRPLTGPRTVGLAGTPVYGQRGADRVSVAAGAVLGAGALVALRVVSGAARSVRDALR